MHRLVRFFLFLLLSAALPGVPALAQGGGQGQPGGGGRRLEKLESARAAFLTTRLNLTTDQAQKFWPLYNEYDAKRRDLRKRANLRGRDMAALSDAQLQGAVTDMMAARQDELNLDKEYLVKFQKVISLRQVLLLYRSEREFTKLVLRELGERRGKRAGGPAGGAPMEDDLGGPDEMR